MPILRKTVIPLPQCMTLPEEVAPKFLELEPLVMKKEAVPKKFVPTVQKL